jgi:hypothetical protein
MNQTWAKTPIEAQQSENRCGFSPHAGAFAGHGNGVNCEIVALDVRRGTAARRRHVNFQAEVACSMHQLHTVSAKRVEAVVDKYDSGLGFHTCCLRTISNKDE